MRLDPSEIDFEAFQAFLVIAGATIEPAKGNGEVMRFVVGKARGIIAQRKTGHFTFWGLAKPMLRDFQAGRPAPIARAVEITRTTLRAGERARGAALLETATTATVFTDGSCQKGGIGRGGWAAIIRSGFATIEVYGGAADTTVNRMEMSAAIAALDLLPRSCAVKILTDSQYLRRGITQWIERWRRNGWRTLEGQPVKNEDLWRTLDEHCAGRTVKWKWVRSHAGISGNERADELARQGRAELAA